jgi:hypothetical protein
MEIFRYVKIARIRKETSRTEAFYFFFCLSKKMPVPLFKFKKFFNNCTVRGTSQSHGLMKEKKIALLLGPVKYKNMKTHREMKTRLCMEVPSNII